MAAFPTPPTAGAERRRFPRYKVALDISFGPFDNKKTPPSATPLERTITIDISLGGLCLYSETRYPIGAQLFCAVTLPDRPTPIEAVGTVVWFQKVDLEERGYKLGVELTQMAPEHAEALKALLEHPPAGQASRAKKLLLVDDDRELQLALKLRFQSAGFQVITADEGLEALRKGREDRPHVIILDLMLPNLNGYEVCRLLKFDQKFRHIPIILFTARSRREDMEMGRAAGADAYVTKPFNGADLIAKVEALLNVGPS